MNRFAALLAAVAILPVVAHGGELANIKVVTDASPDYSDMESMVRSITSKWESDADKMWALFYWDAIGRRQTSPMWLHGYEVSDPIRQYNDYGYAMCSTISGMKCSVWNYMNYPCRFWEIGLHTVPDVWYDGRFHHYDNSLSAIYTLCDGKTVAGVDDIGKPLACEASGGKEEYGHIAIYHALHGTSVNGFLQGADTERTLQHLGAGSFRPNRIRYEWFYYSQDRGHRYSLNLRDGESYIRYYARQDANSPDAVAPDDKNKSYKSDRAYYIPNQGQKGEGVGRDPEQVNIRYHIRGNGERSWTPDLNDQASFYSRDNIAVMEMGDGNAPPAVILRMSPNDSSKTGTAIFKVEGANVITSLNIRATFSLSPNPNCSAAVAISTNNGLAWKEIWKSDGQGSGLKPQNLKLIDEVSGSYEVLVKFTMNNAAIRDISFNTITEINGKTQPQLRLGKNTVYVGNGEQTGSIVFWPDLRSERYRTYSIDEKNVKSHRNRICRIDPTQDAHVTFRMDAPTDLTSVTYGGRLFNSGKNTRIDFLHSFDDGKTWKQAYSLTDNKPPYDVIRYETVSDIPTGTKSILLKYVLAGNEPLVEGVDPDSWNGASCSLYAVRMEANHKLTQPSNKPLEVTFTWQERQKDFSLVQRSHTQLVDKLPATYTVNVGGEDHPIVNSLAIQLAGTGKSGYSDGNENADAEKHLSIWATYGKNLALGKPYTFSAEPLDKKTAWGAEDPELKKLTDGRVGSSYTGGINMREGVMWRAPKELEITLDLGEPQKCAAFRIHTLGYEWWDALKNQSKDQIEVLTSIDGNEYTSQGFFKTNLRRIDIPINFMLPDEETLCAPNLFLAPSTPIEARYVKYKISSPRMFDISEIQVLDSYEFKPFDLKIALPDPSQNGKRSPNADVSPNAKKWELEELPQGVIGVKRK
ncbi:MAG: hypothetical protein FWD53_12375 [Phycisphaerales bacterium]|nr:hypothetical protein [Phycisphaerales bacterium]